MLTTCPPAPRSIILGTKKWHPWTTPIRLIETIQSHSSSGVSRNSAASPTPALLTRMSTAPTASANSRICSPSATSTRRAVTSPPAAAAGARMDHRVADQLAHHQAEPDGEARAELVRELVDRHARLATRLWLGDESPTMLDEGHPPHCWTRPP